MALPNLGGLSLGSPTGADAEALGIADVIKNILSNIDAGNFELACETARIWANQICHANREACDDDDAWIKLTQTAFKHLKVTVKLVTKEDAAEGHSTMAWFFELCNRASRYKVARARLADVTRREEAYRREWLELRLKSAALKRDPLKPNHISDNQEAKNVLRQLRRLEHNMDDPYKPTVPLSVQPQDLRDLVRMLKRSLTADPFDDKILSDVNAAWEAYFGPDEPMEEEDGEGDDAGVDG